MSDFASAFDGIKPAFRRLVEMDPFCLDEVPSPVPAAHPGVYLLSESDRPLYVGRTRDVRGRLSDHRSSAPTRATLAVKMARIAANRPATYTSGNSATHLYSHDLTFRTRFDEARARICAMQVRWVVETDDVRQAMLEIYAAVDLDTILREGAGSGTCRRVQQLQDVLRTGLRGSESPPDQGECCVVRYTVTGRRSARELWSLTTGTTAMVRSASGKRRQGVGSTPNSGATTGHEAELWAMADALRGSMDAAEYKHVVLGLIFLKYISDAFEERRAAVIAEWGEDTAEDRDEYTAENIFWVPPEARWAHLKAQARQSTVGLTVDAAMAAIERDNPALEDVLPRDFARLSLDKQRLGQLIDLVSNIQVGDADARSRDVLGRVYEYFLSQFASAEGKKGGEFYTPRCVVKVLVEMLEPYRGRVYDPCCGSSGMFAQSTTFVRAHANGNGNGGKARADISIYGQESNYTTWRLAKMNLAIRSIEAQIAHGDSFDNDRHPDLRADFILANPPFNVSDWGGERLADDKRWRYGAPPKGNANFAWVPHMVHHLAPAGGAGFVLANGSMSSSPSGEHEIRKNLIEADLVDCMVALPGQLFYSTQIPACLSFLARHRHRPRRGEVLFIDARKLGRMVDRTRRALTDADIARIAGAYHASRDRADAYEDLPALCKSAALDEVRRPRADSRPLRGGRTTAAGRETVRREDAPAGRRTASAAGRGRPARRGHRREPEGVRVPVPRGEQMTVSDMIDLPGRYPGPVSRA